MGVYKCISKRLKCDKALAEIPQKNSLLLTCCLTFL